MNKSSSFDNYLDTTVWRVVDEAIDDLVQNKDLIEETPREYIVGYLCKKLGEMKSSESEFNRD